MEQVKKEGTIMKKGILALVLSLGFMNTSYSCNELGTQGIVEENDLYIPSNIKSASNMTRREFNQVMDDIEEIYKPIVKNLGKRLVIERKWDDGTVNAYAQQIGNKWKVSMFGGLARHKAVTADGFAVVVCHELGHHLGGAPKKMRKRKLTWASNEGQADYFATMKCLRKYMETQDNIKIVKKLKVPSTVKAICNKQFSDSKEIAMCSRGAMAGLSLANLFKSLRKQKTPLKFETPDKKIVTRTKHSHPASQCRLDTYFAGAICEKDHYTDVSSTNEDQGVCSRKFGDEIGVRPLCWFKPSN